MSVVCACCFPRTSFHYRACATVLRCCHNTLLSCIAAASSAALLCYRRAQSVAIMCCAFSTKKVHPVEILVQVLDALRTLTAERPRGAAMLKQCNPFVQMFKQFKEIVTMQYLICVSWQNQVRTQLWCLHYLWCMMHCTTSTTIPWLARMCWLTALDDNSDNPVSAMHSTGFCPTLICSVDLTGAYPPYVCCRRSLCEAACDATAAVFQGISAVDLAPLCSVVRCTMLNMLLLTSIPTSTSNYICNMQLYSSTPMELSAELLALAGRHIVV